MNTDRSDLIKRYQAAIRKIGAPRLLSLPEYVKAMLRQETDLQAKTDLLEKIAAGLQEGGVK